jgi:nucleotide-binding universal stress UspA family protein
MKKVIVCTDGSAYSEESYRYTAWICKSHPEVQIDILYVTDLRQFEVPLIADISGSLGAQPYQNLIAQLQDLEHKKSDYIEDKAKEILKENGFKGQINYEHATGLLVDRLQVDADSYCLIVVGKRGAHCDRAMAHLGSTMERVVRMSPAPCLVTSRAYKKPKHIVFAYDGGPSCNKALKYMLNNPVGDLHVDIITVAPQDISSDLESSLTEATDSMVAAGYKATKHILQGNVETAISDYVDNNGGDFLIMGAYGHSRIRELILGSTTTSLLRLCKVPVLCAR